MTFAIHLKRCVSLTLGGMKGIIAGNSICFLSLWTYPIKHWNQALAGVVCSAPGNWLQCGSPNYTRQSYAALSGCLLSGLTNNGIRNSDCLNSPGLPHRSTWDENYSSWFSHPLQSQSGVKYGNL